jgi:hypothetical protein
MAIFIVGGLALLHRTASWTTVDPDIADKISREDARADRTYKDLLSALALSESSNRYNYVNSLGYAGAYQFGEAALRVIGYYKLDGTNGHPYDWNGGWTGKDGIDSLNEWLTNPAAQDKAVGEWFKYLWTTEIKTLGLQQYVGQTINGVKITESGILAGAHLVGAAAVATYLKSGGSTGVSDPSGTTAASYIAKFAGYAVDPISESVRRNYH